MGLKEKIEKLEGDILEKEKIIQISRNEDGWYILTNSKIFKVKRCPKCEGKMKYDDSPSTGWYCLNCPYRKDDCGIEWNTKTGEYWKKNKSTGKYWQNQNIMRFNFNKKDFQRALKAAEQLDKTRKWVLSILAATLVGVIIGLILI